ncbi:MAG: S8 family serine peptidase [Candidatus Tectomicrobia bacterium]
MICRYIPFHHLALTLFVLIALTSSSVWAPAHSAALEDAEGLGAGLPSNSAQSTNDKPMPGFARQRPPAVGPSRLDENGNGLSDGLEERLASLRPNESVDVIVTFQGPGNAASAQRAVGRFSVKHEYTLIQGFPATMSAAQARALAQTPGVFRVQLDGTVYGFMETARMDFGVDLPGGLPATSFTGNDVIICVIDSGVWPWHEQFADDAGLITKVELFRDFVGDGASIDTLPGHLAHDEHYHGTIVAAIAAGDGTSMPWGDPVIAWPLRGVAPDAAIWSAQALEPDLATGGASGPDSGVVAAVDWCVAEWQDEILSGSNRNLVINLSLGSPGGCAGDALAAAVDAAYAAGAVVMAAAGNSGDGKDSVGVPACAAGAFPVAAAADHSLPFTPGLGGIESNGPYIAPWSSRGNALTSGAAGPGVSIASAFNTGQPNFVALGCPMTVPDSDGATVPNPGCYVAASGTSFAAPFLAGLAAQVFEAKPDLTPAEVYQILRDTARPGGPGGMPNIVAGAGLVDGQAAVVAAQGGSKCIDYIPSPSPIREVELGSVRKNKSVQFPIWIEDPSLPLTITMTINGNLRQGMWSPDLDMQLLDAAGNPYLVPNPLYPWLSSVPFVPAPGTSSTCVAGEDCGLIGVQETIHLPLPVAAGEDLTAGGPHYFLEIYPWDGFPNNGKGGTFTLEFSNAYTSTSSSEPDSCANNSPEVTITLPANGSIFDEGDTITFTGTANDVEEGDLSASIDWSSDLDGFIGTGAPTSTLSLGFHTITAEATDADDATGSDSIGITIEAAGGTGDVVVPDVSYCGDGGRNSDKHLTSIVSVADNSGPIANATVSATITKDSNGTLSGTATTDGFGEARFAWKNAGSGNFTTNVDSVNGDAGITTPNNGVSWPNGAVPCN